MAKKELQLVTAFYDDSGNFSPPSGYAAVGMVVIPSHYIRECSIAWQEMVVSHFPSVQFANLLPMLGIEAKLSELQDMIKRLGEGRSLKNTQKPLRKNGLNSRDKIQSLINDIYQFLANPNVPVKYLAVCTNKEEYWQKFFPEKIVRWHSLNQARDATHSPKMLGKEMSGSLLKNSYHFLLQRLDLLSHEKDFEFSDAFVVGDETSRIKIIWVKQTAVQAGLAKYGDLPSIVNRSWFGSSLHDPCLQIADSIAYTVLIWAEKRDSSILKTILKCFRGYPEIDKIIGNGIVCCPSKDCFPSLY